MRYSCHQCGTPVPMITQYQWQNVDCCSRRVFFTDDRWVFDQELCKARLGDHKKKGYDVVDSSGYIIQTRQVPLPDLADLIKWFYLHQMRKRIQSMPEIVREPYGYGRRQIWAEIVDKYFVQVKSEIGAEHVSPALTKLMAGLKVDIPPALPDAYTIVLISRMINDDLMKELKEDVQDVRQTFYKLYDRICPSVSETANRALDEDTDESD